MMAALLGLVGIVYTNIQSQISDQATRLTRTNNRLNVACERIAVIEFQLNTMKPGTCPSE